jgi:uncharacterized protein YecE (DUF72 family)
MVMVGTAGWAIPRDVRSRFASEGATLERYARVFPCVEINSTFKKVHRRATFERWRASVPTSFRFAVKMPAAISHEGRLQRVKKPLMSFLDDVSALGPALGPLLLQLPPSLPFDARKMDVLLRHLEGRGRYKLVCEPRHASWFTPRAEAWLAVRHVARAAADPARHPTAEAPGGWRGLAYFRLHGSPRMYYSGYCEAVLKAFAAQIAGSPAKEVWCVFDNTAAGAAAGDALRMLFLMRRRQMRAPPR